MKTQNENEELFSAILILYDLVDCRTRFNTMLVRPGVTWHAWGLVRFQNVFMR